MDGCGPRRHVHPLLVKPLKDVFIKPARVSGTWLTRGISYATFTRSPNTIDSWMAGVNLAEDGQSMTREFLNGRLCKRGNNLQPRSKGARVAYVTGFLRDFVHRNVYYSISNPIKEKSIIYIYIYIIGDLIGNYLSIARMESSRNRNRIIDGEEKFRVESNEGYRIIPIPRKRILIFETVVETEFMQKLAARITTRSDRSCHRARSIDITRRPTPSNLRIIRIIKWLIIIRIIRIVSS